MPMTAEQSYALGTPAGRDRINQQLRADPQYVAFLRSIGVNTDGPLRLSDQQRRQAQDWVRRYMGSIGGLEIDASGNLNNPHGFTTELKQWGPVAAAAGGIAAPFVIPALAGLGGGSAAPLATSGMGAGEVSLASAPLGAMGVPTATAASAPLGAAGVAGAAGGAAAAEGAGRGISGFLKDLATPENAAALTALIAGLKNGGSSEQTEEQKRINAITEARMRRSDPLHQVASNLAFGRLPVNYRQGVEMKNVPLPG